jgi:hypothetical protein
MDDKWGPIVFGSVFVLVGIGIGYLFYAYPGGFAEGWSVWAGSFVPLGFIAAGVLVIANALGSMRGVRIAVVVLVACLVAVINWATFFTPHVECVETISAFGIAVFSRRPSLEECKFGLYVLVGTLDAVMVLSVLLFALRRRGQSPSS